MNALTPPVLLILAEHQHHPQPMSSSRQIDSLSMLAKNLFLKAPGPGTQGRIWMRNQLYLLTKRPHCLWHNQNQSRTSISPSEEVWVLVMQTHQRNSASLHCGLRLTAYAAVKTPTSPLLLHKPETEEPGETGLFQPAIIPPPTSSSKTPLWSRSNGIGSPVKSPSAGLATRDTSKLRVLHRSTASSSEHSLRSSFLWVFGLLVSDVSLTANSVSTPWRSSQQDLTGKRSNLVFPCLRYCLEETTWLTSIREGKSSLLAVGMKMKTF